MGKQSESSSLLLRGGKWENPSECRFWPIRSTLDWAVLYSKDRVVARGEGISHTERRKMEYGKECMDYEFILENTAGSLPLIIQSIGSANG